MRHFLLILFSGILFSACQNNSALVNNPSPINLQVTSAVQEQTVSISATKTVEQLLNLKPNQKMYATIKTSLGNIKLELFADKAPETVANFVGLSEGTKDWTDPNTNQKVSNRSLYDNVIFHRVIKDFMIQTGDPLGNGTGGPGYSFADEIDPEKTFDKAGVLAMANSGSDTNGSQFFITTVPTPWLNGKHTIFGQVIEGMETVNAISTAPTNSSDQPMSPITIEKISIVRE